MFTLRKKGTKAVTGALFKRYTLLYLKGAYWYILAPKMNISTLKLYILVPEMYILAPISI